MELSKRVQQKTKTYGKMVRDQGFVRTVQACLHQVDVLFTLCQGAGALQLRGRSKRRGVWNLEGTLGGEESDRASSPRNVVLGLQLSCGRLVVDEMDRKDVSTGEINDDVMASVSLASSSSSSLDGSLEVKNANCG